MQRQQPFDVLQFAAHEFGDFGRRRIAFLRMPEAARCAQYGVDVLDDVNRQAHRARLVHDGALDGLPYPPGRIGREAKAAFGIELLHRMDQPEVALLDQVEQRQATVDVTPCDLDDQPQIALDHAVARRFITLLYAARELLFFRGGQQLGNADVVQVQAGRVMCRGSA